LGWRGQIHGPRSQGPYEDFPDQINTALAIWVTKEEAFASIRRRRAMRTIKKACKPASRYAGPVIWAVESVQPDEGGKPSSTSSNVEINPGSQFER
jgi:hypothetical protein